MSTEFSTLCIFILSKTLFKKSKTPCLSPFLFRFETFYSLFTLGLFIILYTFVFPSFVNSLLISGAKSI